MKKFIIIFWAYNKNESASCSSEFEIGSKEDLAKAIEEFDKEVKFRRYYIESSISPASRKITDEERKWLEENDEIGFADID